MLMSNNLFLLSHCGELNQSGEEMGQMPQEEGLYACLLLVWLRCWTEERKRSVLVDAHFLNEGTGVKLDWSQRYITIEWIKVHSPAAEHILLRAAKFFNLVEVRS